MAFALMMFITAADVLLRYIFNRPISGTMELTSYMMAVVVGFGLLPGTAVGKDVKVLRIGIGIDADTLNPVEITTAIPANITELLYDTLLKTNEKGEFSFKLPKKAELKIVLLAGTGHRGEWNLRFGKDYI